MQSLGLNIRFFRKQSGLTQADLSEQVGVHEVTLRSWERNVYQPRASDIKKLCEVLGVTEAELLNGPTQEKFTVELEFVKTLEGVEETMQMNGIRLVIGEDGYLGVAGGMKFSGQSDIEKVLSEIRFKLEHGLGAQKQMEEERKKLNG